MNVYFKEDGSREFNAIEIAPGWGVAIEIATDYVYLIKRIGYDWEKQNREFNPSKLKYQNIFLKVVFERGVNSKKLARDIFQAMSWK